MHNVTAGYLIFLIILTVYGLTAKRENIITPIIIAIFFLPGDIQLQLGGLNFQGVRFLTIFIFFRVLFMPSLPPMKTNTIDKLVYSYLSISSIVYILNSENVLNAIIYQGGRVVDSILFYFILRKIILDKDDINKIINKLTIFIIILLPFVIFEYFFAKNLFSILGCSASAIRDGEIRATATFRHSILFGSFAAALVPVLWFSYKARKDKITLFSVLSCLFFVISSSSSGPIVATFVGFLFVLFFPWRKYSYFVVICSSIAVTIIHFVRESPIWHLLYVRITVKASSTGYHRYLLTEAAVKEFKNWWLTGYGDIGPDWHTKYWAYTGATFTDLTNQYIAIGAQGGVVPMILYLILCYKSLKILGQHSIKNSVQEEQYIWWGLTGMMFTHCVSFLSVSYFGQITLLFFISIALAAITLDIKQDIQ